jgi:fermentation-respiration switch protein FrsA (DUF1100 family)
VRTDVDFLSGGLTCRGWLYQPEGQPRDQPAIVMATGFSGVKEMGLQPFAERFAAEGFAVLLFDFRHLGASDGIPRGHVLAHTQLDDLRAALGFLSTHPGVDADRLALWGTSFGGSHAMLLGALDPRVKAVTTMVPALGMARTAASAGRMDNLRQLAVRADAARNSGQQPTVPIVAAGDEPCAMPGPESFTWLTKQAEIAPNWRNAVTIESLVRAMEYAPTAYIDLIAPNPLLIQAAEHDAFIPIGEVKEAFSRAEEPKRLDVFPCGHFEIYDPPYRDQALDSQVAWLNEHLK